LRSPRTTIARGHPPAPAHGTHLECGGDQRLHAGAGRYAGQSERRDAARTFVAVDGDAVVAYYTPVAGEIA
jgi:hypothetical protein